MAARDQTTVGAYRQQTIERVFGGLLSARLDEMAQKPDAPFLDARDQPWPLRALGRGDDAERAGRRRRRRERAGGALHRSRPGRPVRLHADRAGPLSPRLPAGLRAARRLQRRAHLAVAGRRVHPQLHAAGTDSRHRLRERPGPAVPAGDHARRHQQPGPRLGAGSQPRRRRERAEEGRRRRARRGGAGGGHQGRRRRRADGVRGRGEHAAAHRRRCPSRAPSRRRVAKTPGITEWTLSNGVRVVLAPTTFKQDEILVRAFSPGGTSLARRSGLRRRRDRRPGRGAGRSRRAERHRSEQEARRQDRVRASRHRRDVRGPERPRLAPRSGDDVSVDLPDVHAAARRSGSVPRDDRPADGGAGQPRGAAGDGVRGRAQRGGEPEPPAGAAHDVRRSSRR